MSKTIVVAKILNGFLILLMLAAVTGFISFMNAYGAFLALVTALIAWGVFKHNRISYFAAAAWGLACYQLAKEGYEFQTIKHQVMLLGVVVIPLALFLHETLGLRGVSDTCNKTAQENILSGNNDQMPL